jgi:hypothetical protein
LFGFSSVSSSTNFANFLGNFVKFSIQMFFLFRQKKGGEFFCFSSISNSTNFANLWEIFVKFSIQAFFLFPKKQGVGVGGDFFLFF